MHDKNDYISFSIANILFYYFLFCIWSHCGRMHVSHKLQSLIIAYVFLL